MTVKLEGLSPGGQITGLAGGQPISVVQAEWIGGKALRFTYRTLDGRLDERIHYPDHESRLDLHTAGSACEFRTYAKLFTLAAGSLRIEIVGDCM